MSTVRGAAAISAGTALIAVGDVGVALLADRVGLWQFHATRSAMILPLAIGLAAVLGRLGLLGVAAPRRVAERTAFSVGALMLYFAALPAVGISQAAAGIFSSPLWVVVIAGTVFGERIGPLRLVALLIGLLGMALVLGLTLGPPEPMGLVAIGAGILYALSVIWTRAYCASETPAALAVWQFGGLLVAGLLGLAAQPLLAGLLSATPGAEFATRPWAPPDAALLGAIFAIGVAGILATGLMAAGYRAGPSSIMGLFDFTFLLWAPFAAWALLGERITPETALGMGLLALAGILAALAGARQRHETR